MKFDHLGVFTYSEEEGTRAAELEDNISRELKDERKAVIMDIQNNINYEKNSIMVGQTKKVIISLKIMQNTHNKKYPTQT